MEMYLETLNDEEWKSYINEKHSSYPGNYISDLSEKHLLLIHGKEDHSIRHYHTENFYNKLREAGSKNVELLLKENVGHGTKLRSSTIDYWTNWIIKLLE